MKSTFKNRDRALVLTLFGLLAANTSMWDHSRWNLAREAKVETSFFSSQDLDGCLTQALTTGLAAESSSNPCPTVEARVGDTRFQSNIKISKAEVTDTSQLQVGQSPDEAEKKSVVFADIQLTEAGCSQAQCLGKASRVEIQTGSVAEAIQQIRQALEKSASELAEESEKRKEAEERRKKIAELRRELRERQGKCELSSSSKVDEEELKLVRGKWDSGERMECQREHMAGLEGKEAEDYFHRHLKSSLKDMLLSGDSEQRRQAQELLRELSQDSELRRIPSLQFSLQNMHRGAQLDFQIQSLQRLASAGNSYAQVQLEMLQNQINGEYSMTALTLRQQLTAMDPSSPQFAQAEFMLRDLEQWTQHFASTQFPSLQNPNNALAGLDGNTLHSIIMAPPMPQAIDLRGRLARAGNAQIMNQTSQWTNLQRFNPPSVFNTGDSLLQPHFSGQVPPTGLEGRGQLAPRSQGAAPGPRQMPARIDPSQHRRG